MKTQFYIGTAGWSVPSQQAGRFPAEGSHLERYSQRLPAVEINTSFYRPHRPATYERWAASTPEGFCFSVKLIRTLTHESRLRQVDGLAPFIEQVCRLGEKLGPVLVQLPPSLPFNEAVAEKFFLALRQHFEGDVVCEPRHPSWFTAEVEKLLAGFRIARAAADPAVVPPAALPGGWDGLVYYRLHGSPKMYYSPYPPEALDRIVQALLAAQQSTGTVWCIFDNTAEGAAAANALTVQDQLYKFNGGKNG